MLTLDLSRIRSAEEHFEREYQPGMLGPDSGDYRVVAPVRLAFDVFKDKQQFRLAGSVATSLELSCSRCLEAFVWPVDSAFDLRYVPQAAAGAEPVEREIDDDDMATSFYQNDEIDLGQLMGEQFYLSLPMKPLCSEDCRGLCPVCGTNRNRATCDCQTQWDDPRLAALRALKKDF